ncbi:MULTISPECIES: ABC transporter permease [Gracilibacillus]|uniref:ABC transporter permease n=1 Tax=Gracilibacillus TaxID=74385 RepID=UPI000824F6F7|nr:MULTISPECIES: ABC transporter permease [Gracilibacillus]
MVEQTTNSVTHFLHWFKKHWKNNPLFSIFIALVVMVILQTIVLGFDYPTFGDWFQSWTNNWINILRNNASIAIVALGMTFVIMTGGIDLAVGATLVATGAFAMTLLDAGANGLLSSIGITGWPAIILTILLVMVFGYLLGSLIGVSVTRGMVPPFIATLGAMMVFRSVTQHVMQGASPRVPSEFLQISNFKIGDLMIMPILYWIIIAAIMYFISKKTTFGRQIIAVGSNERAARLSGINVKKVKFRVYALSGMLVGIAAIIQVSRIGSMDFAGSGRGMEMDAIAAAVVGGTSMMGGRGFILGTVYGMLIIAVLNNLLNLFGVPPLLRDAFKGAIVIGAVLLQRKEQSA